MRTFSYGGGVQSTAALVLAAHGEINYPTFLFSNVGDDSEYPDTLRYVYEVAMPFALAHGIELVELRRGGKYASLLDKIQRLESALPIPIRMSETGKPGRRSCTADFKIAVIAKELKRRGATKERPATVGLGISIDEYQRVRSAEDPRQPTQRRDYPLIAHEITRQDCMNIIAAEGLEVPSRSACWFCPFHSLEEWRRLQRTRPDLFEKAVALERLMIDRQERHGKGPVYFTDHGAAHHLTLDRVIGPDIQLEFTESNCESGYCWT